MKKVENLRKAVKNLHEIYNYQEPYDVVTQTGMVSLFEIAFEQSWKAMKACLEYSGYGEAKTGSPRSIIKLAYSAGMVQDEEVWLSALSARNNIAHTYNDELALEIITSSKEKYVSMFDALLEEINKNWIA